MALTIREYAEGMSLEAELIPGLDDALVGQGESSSAEGFVPVYDQAKVRALLAHQHPDLLDEDLDDLLQTTIQSPEAAGAVFLFVPEVCRG